MYSDHVNFGSMTEEAIKVQNKLVEHWRQYIAEQLDNGKIKIDELSLNFIKDAYEYVKNEEVKQEIDASLVMKEFEKNL